jgi:release factor glutamine methyltransferase
LLALLSELPNAVGIGTDISVDALSIACINAHRHELALRTHFICCDLAAALRGPFELIVSNPPYIASAEIGRLAPEVRDHDPRLALDGGADGLDVYRAIAGDARRLLAERGRLIVELGQGQSDMVSRVFTQAGLAVNEEPRRDLSGINRALSASTP